MIIRKASAAMRDLVQCHHGQGILHCTEILADYRKEGPGIAFIHDNTVEPGASIGEHEHKRDEEVYIILDGRGMMRVDGVEHEVGPGDVCLTRSGHTHSLINGPQPMRILVIGVNV
jgi:uncharacterized cupin superfamily protein